MEGTVCDAFFVTVFKSLLRFRLSRLEMERFQKAPLLKPFSVMIVFGRFSVDDLKGANENSLAWSGSDNPCLSAISYIHDTWPL